MEVKIPKLCTTANPLTGPEPNASKAIPAINVVMLESRIVPQARSKPVAIAACGVAPALNSSRIRSLIKTLESRPEPSLQYQVKLKLPGA
jgi:hypothetical protein